MRTNTHSPRPSIVPEASLTVHHRNRPQGQRPGLIKSMAAIPAPDESFIKKLNEVAAQAPFSRPYKARHHDTL